MIFSNIINKEIDAAIDELENLSKETNRVPFRLTKDGMRGFLIGLIVGQWEEIARVFKSDGLTHDEFIERVYTARDIVDDKIYEIRKELPKRS